MINISNLTVSYEGNTVLNNINLTIKKGSITGIIGPNGAGKSTLLKGMLKIIPTDSGNITVDGEDIEKARKKIAYVEQRSKIDLTFPITVKDVVLTGTYPKLGLFHSPKKKQKQKVMECLRKVEMEDYQKRQIGELSGGQLQRIFITRALAQEAEILLLDEPFVGIDIISENVIVNLLKELKNANKTIVVVHHDLSKVIDYFDNLIILNSHLIDSGATSEVFTKENLHKAYGNMNVLDFAKEGACI